MMKTIYLLLILVLAYVVYQTYKTNTMPDFAVKAIEKIKAFKNWLVNKFKKDE